MFIKNQNLLIEMYNPDNSKPLLGNYQLNQVEEWLLEQARLENNRDRHDELRGVLALLREIHIPVEELADAEEDIADRDRQIENLKEEKEALQTSNCAMEDHIYDLDLEIDRLKETISNLQKKLNDLEQK